MDFLKGLYDRITGRVEENPFEEAEANVYVTDNYPENVVVDVQDRDIWISTNHSTVWVRQGSSWTLVVHEGRKYE